MESYQTSPEQDRLIREHAVTGAVAAHGLIAVTGRDRASFLQGLLTNDIQALEAGRGCYAAWLNPQGRMLTDIHVFESGEMILLDVPSQELAPTLERLDQFLFSEDVQFADLTERLTPVWAHGPAASRTLEIVLSGVIELDAWPDYRHGRAAFAGMPIVVARVDQLGVPGFCVFVEPSRSKPLTEALAQAGVLPGTPAAIEAARVEAGYPLWGIDMTDDTIPLEAGIEQRAISFTKGCYVGQEVIIRVLHRGHGRVARKLRGLSIDGDPPEHGTRIFAADRDVGFVTSSAWSPRLGTIALGYLHRDAAEGDVPLEVQVAASRVRAAIR